MLIDGEQLAQLMIDYNLGCTTQHIYELKKIDSDYFGGINAWHTIKLMVELVAPTLEDIICDHQVMNSGIYSRMLLRIKCRGEKSRGQGQPG